jgi:hypothetical protein
MTSSVRIESNGDGTYSAYIYGTVVCIGTYAECESSLDSHCPERVS